MEREEEKGEREESAFIPLRIGMCSKEERERTGAQFVLTKVLDIPWSPVSNLTALF